MFRSRVAWQHPPAATRAVRESGAAGHAFFNVVRQHVGDVDCAANATIIDATKQLEGFT